MGYVTIYNSLRPNKITILRNLLEEHNIDFRILQESEGAAVPTGQKVQVREDQVKRAKDLLKESKFFGTPEPEPNAKATKKFLWFLLFALLAVIIVSVIINSLR